MTTLETEVEDDNPVRAYCAGEELIVELRDGRAIKTPLWWYPRLLAASQAQRNDLRLSRTGVHWDALDEDLSVAGMLRGSKAPGATPPAQAAE